VFPVTVLIHALIHTGRQTVFAPRVHADKEAGFIHAATQPLLLTRYMALYVSVAQQPLVEQGLLIIEALRSHSDTSRSLGILWTSDQREHRDLYLHNTQHSQETKDSNPQSQKASGRRPTPYTARPPGSSYTLYISDHL
jgi:hypothetical protein